MVTVLFLCVNLCLCVTDFRSCMMLHCSSRLTLNGSKQQRNGKLVWMKPCGRQRSAGCSVKSLPNGCLRTGELTALTACLKRQQVRSRQKFWARQKETRKSQMSPVFVFCPALSLSLLSCRQSCVTQVATRPGRISAQEDFLPTQLEHLHIAQFKGLLGQCEGHTRDFIIHLKTDALLCITLHPRFPAGGDISGALQMLRSLLLFYPSDKDSLDNLQLYHETLGGDTESQSTQPAQVPFKPLKVHYIEMTTVV